MGTAEETRRKGIEKRKSGKKDEYWKYTPLVKAALKGDWDAANEFFKDHPEAITAPITRELESALYLATGVGPMAIPFVRKLLERMPAEALAHRDEAGNTPLHLSALVDNTAAAKLLVGKNRELLCMREGQGWLPVHYAAVNKKKRETLEYLLKATGEDEVAMSMLFLSSEYDKVPSGAELLIDVITSGYYDEYSLAELKLAFCLLARYCDIALDLVHWYPQLALSQTPKNYDCGLGAIARQAKAFPSGTDLNFWERIVYDHVPVKFKNYAEDSRRDEDIPVKFENYAEDSSKAEFGIENPVNNSELPAHKYYWARFLGKIFSIFGLSGNTASPKWQVQLWKCSELGNEQAKHQQALQLVRYLIKVMLTLNDLNEYDSLATEAMISATRLGIHEVVEEIVEAVPKLAWVRDSEDYSLFQRAVIQRHESIFNLIYQMSHHRRCQTLLMDKSQNTILHLAGKLAPPDKLQSVNGAALQMQREFQWYKEVKKHVKPNKETPAMVFTREHEKLVDEGRKWMKGTADSCTISAALIVTVAFAAIIAVPGGNNDYGLPNFSKEWAFTVFVISDALSLFTSATSLLLFLSILTTRYAESDFRDVLPRQLIYGLVTLFLSITTMIMAFSVSLYLVLGHKKAWILVPVAALAFLPISSFVSLQFPLLVDLISSAYGSIFGPKSGSKQFF
ncbi:uncharacterized protein LOC131326816 [Rhododendron vialii]|uniref:uncharacterized protein LOC131326816 n=1 Tax=Rhododendron vialii TaxID=182163 RepID=UPI00265EF0AD|nr:uncharacterized protein LOC131326816 [Rhododendron vialii]